MVVWVDADACPVQIKEILFRAAERAQIRTVLMATTRYACRGRDSSKLSK
jgi:hypothetical protein